MHSKVDLIFAPRGTAPALPYSALATKEVDGAARSWSTDTSPRSRIAGRSSDSPRRTGLPAVYAVCEDVDEGGLLSYGANVADISRRAARYAGRILEGAKPADLPVEQATAVELVITMRTAKALGLTIPRRCCGKRSG
jgi:hypothetical protein